MAPGHPPRFVVRPAHDAARERRRRLWLGGGWLLSLFAVAGIAWSLAARTPIRGRGAGTGATQAEAEALRQQVANLQRAGQVADVAAKELKRNLAERDEEISGLRTDLAFYSRLVGGAGQRDGLNVQGARTFAVQGAPNAWNVVVTLTQNAQRGNPLNGAVALAVEGIQDHKVATLEGTALGQATAASRIAFSFRYFQQVQGSFTLPAGFQPTRLRLVAQADGGQPVTRVVPWADAIRNEASDVQP